MTKGQVVFLSALTLIGVNFASKKSSTVRSLFQR